MRFMRNLQVDYMKIGLLSTVLETRCFENSFTFMLALKISAVQIDSDIYPEAIITHD